ncbi:hypothetical protein, partial [Neisseria sicca]|uniref:hypothetical protein n=1 Tax=Neisseria sicca TaxID=490 RepID=UPI0011BD0202
MGIRENMEDTKRVVNEGVDLVLLGMQILNVDLGEEGEKVLGMMIWLVVWGMLVVIGFMSVVLGVKGVLWDSGGIWVLFGIRIVRVIVIGV